MNKPDPTSKIPFVEQLEEFRDALEKKIENIDAATVRAYPDDGFFKEIWKDVGVAFLCVVSLWLLSSGYRFPIFIPCSVLGLSFARYLVKTSKSLALGNSRARAVSRVAIEVEEVTPNSKDEKAILEESFVFVSYSRQDQDYVRKLVEEFENRGLHVWLDDRIDYGSAWPRIIEHHLEKSQAFVLVMTAHSRESHWVSCELNRALEMRKPIFPILLEGRRWLEVAAIQTFDVEENALPPERFFEKFL